MRPASSRPVEAAAVARRAGMLARARPGSSAARARAWEHGVSVGSAPSAARRRLLVASLGVGEPVPAQSSLGEEAVALEVDEVHEDDVNYYTVSAEHLPPADSDVPEAKTVRVKFVLKKQCAFGQQFLVVGDDAALGLWDPAKAIPLNWSEEHVWTAKTDLPANKLIEFKFLLRDASGNVRWQHGDNRTLQTLETPNTMVVHEDWDHAMKQRVSEEDELSVVGEDLMFSEDVAGSNSENKLSVMGEDVMFSDDVAGSNPDDVGGEDVMFSDDVAGSNGAVVGADNPQTDENLDTDKLAAVADADAPDAPLRGETIVPNGANQPQLMVDKGQTIPSGSNDDDDTVLRQEHDLLANRPPIILENDLAWAGKAMQQLLRILGFQIGTTRT
ncbi:hypothetical protein U9M48_017094 [Paspalum notatum var. saurae]|uniref:CBM20 domain-containing protein n=1 Tax=Paspalum notatum var. saurae TaxID=547442 RepID=A0AAQ3WNH6_PASNO